MKNSINKKLVVLTVLSLCFGFSCSEESTFNITCDATTISFASEVKPIIDSKCATNSGCHGSGSNHGPGALTTYTQIFQFKSQISTSIKNGSMPKGSSLTSEQRNLIVCWIENGAPNN